MASILMKLIRQIYHETLLIDSYIAVAGNSIHMPFPTCMLIPGPTESWSGEMFVINVKMNLRRQYRSEID